MSNKKETRGRKLKGNENRVVVTFRIEPSQKKRLLEIYPSLSEALDDLIIKCLKKHKTKG